MASKPTLKLPTAPDTAVFRLIDRQLRNNPLLQSIGLKIRSWEGEPVDKQPLSIDQAPIIRLTPLMGPEDFWAADSQKGMLSIRVEMLLKSTCSDDVSNLWFALMRALYPADQAARNAFILALQEAGAWKGLIRFSLPAADRGDDIGSDGTFQGAGLMQIEVKFPVNS